MSRVGRRLRSRRDYIIFQIVAEWPLLLSAAGVILGAAALLPSTVAIVMAVLAVAIGVGALMRDLRQLRRRWSDYEFSLIAAPFPIADIPAPASYPSPAYLHVPGRGTVLVSDAIDAVIAGQDMTAVIDEEPYRLPLALKASAPYVLPVCNHGRLVFNGRVVGMHGDPLPPGSRPVRLHIARFFDSQCSNEMCGLRITHRRNGTEFDPRWNLLTTTDSRLKTLAESTMADVVGISTIAFTTDGLLVLIRQSRRNVGSPLLLAPSGSGSLHPDDLGPETLQEIVGRAMERELAEETGLRPDEIAGTKVIGFARWLERGAKPEFFGITELNVSSSSLAGRRQLAPGERLYSGGTLTMRVDLAALGRELADSRDLLEAPSLPGRLREDGSLPLLAILRAAALRRVSARS